jgi:hypothetical protein
VAGHRPVPGVPPSRGGGPRTRSLPVRVSP